MAGRRWVRDSTQKCNRYSNLIGLRPSDSELISQRSDDLLFPGRWRVESFVSRAQRSTSAKQAPPLFPTPALPLRPLGLMPTAWQSRQSPSVPDAASNVDVSRHHFRVIMGLFFCSGRLPDSVPTTGADQAEEPQRIMGELGMELGVCLTDSEVPVLPSCSLL